MALLEFALGFPIVLSAGLYGIEITNLAITHVKVSQIALKLADNMSRMDNAATLSKPQVREADINDAIEAVRDQGQSIRLTTNGRVILSSLEYQTGGAEVLHWQRCIGLKSGTGYDSSYGNATPLATAGTTTNSGDAGVAKPSGMGDTGSLVNAYQGDGIIFVEINYLYTPLFNWLSSPSKIHYIASYNVRDNRDFTMLQQIYNSSTGSTNHTCDLYSA